MILFPLSTAIYRSDRSEYFTFQQLMFVCLGFRGASTTMSFCTLIFQQLM